MKKADCIFCRIAGGEIPSRTLFEDESFRVILDLNPITRGHALILPKEHADNLYELSEETAGEVMKLAKKMALQLKDTLGADGMNLVQNNGVAAGQTVNHFHLHLVPRYGDNGQNISWESKEASGEELDEVWGQITKER